LTDERNAGEYLVRNLSAGGALLEHGPPIRPGTDIHLVLQGPGVDNVSIDGVILREGRISDRSLALAVGFRGLGPGKQDSIQRLVLRALEQVSASAVLVVHPVPTVLVAIARELHALGRRVALAVTPLEIIRWLSDPDARIEAILVTWPYDEEHGAEMLSFLRDEFPHIRRIALCESTAPGEQLLPLFGNVDALLNAQWTRSNLKVALQGIFPGMEKPMKTA
jgi:hypothetical protein